MIASCSPTIEGGRCWSCHGANAHGWTTGWKRPVQVQPTDARNDSRLSITSEEPSLASSFTRRRRQQLLQQAAAHTVLFSQQKWTKS
ncbi:unnamed protein product, partial [Trichogramma brassicae]